MPHEGENEEIEGPSLSCDEHEEVPERGASVNAIADLADASRHPRPLQRQLRVEARHQHFDTQKSLSNTKFDENYFSIIHTIQKLNEKNLN